MKCMTVDEFVCAMNAVSKSIINDHKVVRCVAIVGNYMTKKTTSPLSTWMVSDMKECTIIMTDDRDLIVRSITNKGVLAITCDDIEKVEYDGYICETYRIVRKDGVVYELSFMQ